MKKRRKFYVFVLIILVIVGVPFAYKKLYNNKKENNVINNSTEVMNYSRKANFSKNGQSVRCSDLKTDPDGEFNYDIEFEIGSKGENYKLVALLNYSPTEFSLNGDEFSKEKSLNFKEGTDTKKLNIKFKDKIIGYSVCNFIFIREAQSKDNEIRDEHFIFPLSGSINNTDDNRAAFKEREFKEIKGETLDENISKFVLNGKISKKGPIVNDDIITTKPGKQVKIPIAGKAPGSNNDCFYCLFMDNKMIKIENNDFSDRFKVVKGNSFSKDIIINAPSEKGEYTIFAIFAWDPYSRMFPGIMETNKIILKVE